MAIEPFDYVGVRLGESHWKKQYEAGREFYLGLSNDDILCGFRKEAGLPAPGKTLGGWCQDDSSMVFGQWLSGLARMVRATGDTQARDKASYLLAEFAKTVGPNGDCRMGHYQFDKLVCGLVDMKLYADNADAVPLLDKTVDWARKTLAREPMIVLPNDNKIYYGLPQEWYTLSENLYRAYELTGDPKYKTFAEVWLYHRTGTSSPTPRRPPTRTAFMRTAT